jgi:hypothetical protein
MVEILLVLGMVDREGLLAAASVEAGKLASAAAAAPSRISRREAGCSTGYVS